MTSTRSRRPRLRPNPVRSHQKRHRPGQTESKTQTKKHRKCSLHLFAVALLCFQFPPLFLPFILAPAWISSRHFCYSSPPLFTSSFQFFDCTASHLQSVNVLIITYCSFTSPFLCSVNAWILHACLQSSLCLPLPRLFPSFKNSASSVVFWTLHLHICSVTSCFLVSSFE